MAERLGEALLDLRTDDKGYKRGVDQAERQARGLGQRLEDTSRRAAALGKSLALGAAVGAAALGALVIKTANDIAVLKAEAATAGIAFDEFQRLKYAAEQNLVGVEALTDGLKEMNLRADEFVVTGGGSAAEAFKRLGFSADELKAKLADPSALFMEIIDRLSQLDTASQIRISDEIFGGTGGEQFVRLLRAGADGVQALMDRFDELGLGISGETAVAAEQFTATMKRVRQTVDVLAIRITEGILPSLNEFADRLADPEFVENATILANGVVGAFNLIIDVIEKVVAGMRWVGETLDWLATHDLFGNPLTQPGLSDDEFEARFNPELSGKTDRLPRRQPPEPRELDFGDLSDIDVAAETSALEARRHAVADLIAQLEMERDILRETDPVQREMIALRELLAAATPKQASAIRELVAEQHREREALRENEEAMRDTRDVLDSLASTFMSGIEAGKSFWEALGDAATSALDKIIDKLLNELLDAIFEVGDASSGGFLGGIGNFFKNIFAGFRADGGLIPTGTFGIVGERGPEPVIGTSRGAMVLPNSTLSQAAGRSEKSETTVRLLMPEGWRAEIVGEAVGKSADNTVRIVEGFQEGRENRWQNGADFV